VLPSKGNVSCKRVNTLDETLPSQAPAINVVVRMLTHLRLVGRKQGEALPALKSISKRIDLQSRAIFVIGSRLHIISDCGQMKWMWGQRPVALI